jgi:hypothetical protein
MGARGPIRFGTTVRLHVQFPAPNFICHLDVQGQGILGNIREDRSPE